MNLPPSLCKVYHDLQIAVCTVAYKYVYFEKTAN